MSTYKSPNGRTHTSGSPVISSHGSMTNKRTSAHNYAAVADRYHGNGAKTQKALDELREKRRRNAALGLCHPVLT